MAACFFCRHGDDTSSVVQTYPRWTTERLPEDYGCYSLNYILEGRGVLVDQFNRRFPVAAGCLLQVSLESTKGKCGPHMEETENLLECGIHFNVGLGRKLEEIGIWIPSLQRVDNVFDTSIVNRYVRFYDCLGDQALSPSSIIREAVAMIDAVYARFESKPGRDDLIVRACELLSEHPEQGYGTAKVADELGLSYSAFRRKFTQQMGIPPITYHVQQKINMACSLLDRLTVKEVSFKLGYKNESAFSKQFKKLVGLSPNAFRRSVARK